MRKMRRLGHWANRALCRTHYITPGAETGAKSARPVPSVCQTQEPCQGVQGMTTVNEPDGYLEEVRDVLRHLYDYPYLGRHPLALRHYPQEEQRGPRRAHQLHRLVLETIEALNRPAEQSEGTELAQYYWVLVYRYVEARDLGEILHELSCSRRQFFRLQSRAMALFASLLREKLPPPAIASTAEGDLLASEARRVLADTERVDPAAIMEGVLETVRPLMQGRGVTVDCELAQDTHTIRGSRTLLRQVFLKALHVLGSHEP